MSCATTRSAAASAAVLAFFAAGCGASVPAYDDGAPEWSPDGRRIAFVRTPVGHWGGEVNVMWVEGGGRRSLAGDAVDLTWGPNGARLAFESVESDSSEVWTVGLGNGALTRLTDNDVDDSHPAWSPDGTELAISRETWYRGPERIVAFDLATGRTRRISRGGGPGGHWWPDWSPDGMRIALVDEGRGKLLVTEADGANTRAVRLPAGIGAPVTPSWSPDGSTIAFATSSFGDPESGEIYTVRPDGTGLRRLTRNGVWDTSPDWSPDGKRIVFARDRGDGRGRIYVMDARGRHARALIEE
jgi:TolB protein